MTALEFEMDLQAYMTDAWPAKMREHRAVPMICIGLTEDHVGPACAPVILARQGAADADIATMLDAIAKKIRSGTGIVRS